MYDFNVNIIILEKGPKADGEIFFSRTDKGDGNHLFQPFLSQFRSPTLSEGVFQSQLGGGVMLPV